jgi:acetyl-CoA C-acetyltransferase
MAVERRDVSIVGIGKSEFRIPESRGAMAAMATFGPFATEAVKRALKDTKNIEVKRDIEATYAGRSNPVTNAAQMISSGAGYLGEACYSVDNGSTSGPTALMCGCNDIACGSRDVVVVVGFETIGPGALYIHKVGQSWECIDGVESPPYARLFAQLARRHMREYGTTKEQLAMVAAKNRKNGSLNPDAFLKEEVSVDDVLNSRVVAEPLTEYMCAPLLAGGVAFVLAPSKQAGFYTKNPIRIAGYGSTTAKPGLEYLESAYDPIVRAAREAYRMAGPFFSTRDVDVAQVHDEFAITELIAYEALGFCGRGKGGKWIEDGVPMLDGDLPVNTDGGMIANGMPLGACGLTQIYELVLQLRGKAGKRQIKDAERALAFNGSSEGASFCGGYGGRGFGTGGSYSVTILAKE